MSQSFFDRPILNSPYDYPAMPWELAEAGQPTNLQLVVLAWQAFRASHPEPGA